MILLKNGIVYQPHGFEVCDILIHDGKIAAMGQQLHAENADIFDVTNQYILPGFVDAHVHLREPGFSYKETIKQGCLAAAKGGFTTIFTMPNVSPVPDTLSSLNIQRDIIAKDACITVIPYGAITKGQKGEALADMEQMAPYVGGFSDDGKGVQSSERMEEAMRLAVHLERPLVLHCEDEAEVKGGYIHDGAYAKIHHHQGINSVSEYGIVEREIKLAKKTGAHIHICHISAKETLRAIQEGKKRGVHVTCEVTPHHLLLDENDLQEDGNFKMNPPLRCTADRLALIEGLCNGTIDIIASDHAPHALEEKNKGLAHSMFGIIGLEDVFALLYTGFVIPNHITLHQLIHAMSIQPSKICGLPSPRLCEGAVADLVITNLDKSYTITTENIISTSKNTPFLNRKVQGVITHTMHHGIWVYKEEAHA